MRDLLERVAGGYVAHGCATRAAALAFYALFVLVPIPIFAVSAVAALVGDELARPQVIEALRALAGEQIAMTIDEALASSGELAGGWLARLFGLVSLLFGSAAFFVELQDSLNAIWGVPGEDFRLGRFLRARLASFVMVLAAGGALLALSFAGTLARAFGARLTALLPVLTPTLGVVGLLVSLLVIAGLFGLVFRYIPDVRVPSRAVGLGALATAALFVAGNELIGLYLRHTGLATAYGAAGSLVLTLTWVYYSALAFLFGAELTRCLGEIR